MLVRQKKDRYNPPVDLIGSANNQISIDIINFNERGVLASFLTKDKDKINLIRSISFKYKMIEINVELSQLGFQYRQKVENIYYAYTHFSKDSINKMKNFINEMKKDCELQSCSKYNAINDEIYEILAQSSDKIKLNRDSMLSWLYVNGIDNFEEQKNTLAVIRESFPEYHLSKNDIQKMLTEFVRKLKKYNYTEVDIIPIHMPKALLNYLIIPFWDELNNVLNVINKPRLLYDFINDKEIHSNEKKARGLIVLDCIENTGAARKKFLNTLKIKCPWKLKSYYKDIYLVALSGYNNDETFSEGDCNVHQVTLKRINLDERPFSSKTLSDYEKTFIGNLHDHRLQSMYEHFAKDKSIFTTYYFGCPYYALPFLWSDDDYWYPLLKRHEYYYPQLRPIPRAPMYTGNNRAIRLLLKLVDNGGIIFIAGGSGAGKTYIAAKVAELKRPTHYVFWHECIVFDTIESLLDHFDSFFNAIGMAEEPDFGSMWDSMLSMDAIIGALQKRFEYLDRDLLIILDHVENVCTDLDVDNKNSDSIINKGNNLLWNFIKKLFHLINNLNNSDSSKISAIAISKSNILPPLDETTTQMTTAFGIPKSNIIFYPLSGDLLDDSQRIRLAQKLLCKSLNADDFKIKYERFAKNEHYKVWLVSYIINTIYRQNSVPHNLNDKIDSLLTEDLMLYYEKIEYFHKIIVERLPMPSEVVFLFEVASALVYPWSIGDMKKVLNYINNSISKKLCDSFEVIISELIITRCPFLLSLGKTDQLDDSLYSNKNENRLLHDYSNAKYFKNNNMWICIDDSDRFEMPSVSKKYFENRLKENTETACLVNRAIADMFGSKYDKEINSTHYQKSNLAAAHFSRPLNILFQQIYYYIISGSIAEAVDKYNLLAEKYIRYNPWDRLLYLGELINKAIRNNNHDYNTNTFKFAATYANTLTKTLRLNDAIKICKDIIDSVSNFQTQNEHWWNLQLIKARILRFNGDYKVAIKDLTDSLNIHNPSSIPIDNQKEMNTVLFEIHNEIIKIYMALGEIPEAGLRIERLKNSSQTMKDLGREDLSSEVELGDGTVKLLTGKYSEAKKVFEEIYNNTKDGKIKCISKYKVARVYIEMIRETENLMDLLGDDFNEKHKYLIDECLKDLKIAIDIFNEHIPHDVWWQTNIELAQAEVYLLQSRNLVCIELNENSTLTYIPEAENLLNLANSQLRTSDENFPGSKSLELNTIKAQILCYRNKLNVDLIDNHNAEKIIDDYLNAFPTIYNDDELFTPKSKSNYLVQARYAYERCIYILLLEHQIIKKFNKAQYARNINMEYDIYNKLRYKICDEFKFATQILYEYGMVGISRQFHMLIINIFKNHPLGLQERVESYSYMLADANPEVLPELRNKIDFNSLFETIAENSITMNSNKIVFYQPLLFLLTKAVYNKLSRYRNKDPFFENIITTLKNNAFKWLINYGTESAQISLYNKFCNKYKNDYIIYFDEQPKKDFIKMFEQFRELLTSMQ